MATRTPAAKPHKPLTPQEELFAAEYIANGFVAVAAYRIAYPDAKEKTAQSNAYYMLRKAHVRAYILEIMKDHLGDFDDLAAKTLIKLEQIAFAERGDEYYASGAQLKALELIQKQLGLQTQNIKAQVDQTTTVVINILGDGDED